MKRLGKAFLLIILIAICSGCSSKENKKIDLSIVRTKEFEDNYKTINEFSDGKNIERIYENLEKLKIV